MVCRAQRPTLQKIENIILAAFPRLWLHFFRQKIVLKTFIPEKQLMDWFEWTDMTAALYLIG